MSRPNTLASVMLRVSDPKPDTGCMEWTGFRNSNGYGVISVRGKLMLAHRAAFLAAGNHLPDGLHVLHRCDNPPCCNPYHLFSGTDADNSADRQRKGRGNVGRGEKQHLSKLTDEVVRFIRNSNYSGPQLAKMFGVTRATINRARRGAGWAHVK